DRVAGLALSFGQPGPQDLDGGRGERGDPLFAAFAAAVQVSTWSEVDVAAAQADEFGHAQPALRGDGDQGVVPPAEPAGSVRGREECVGLAAGEVVDQGSVVLLGGDGEH